MALNLNKIVEAQGRAYEQVGLLLAEIQATNRWLAHLAKILEDKELVTVSPS